MSERDANLSASSYLESASSYLLLRLDPGASLFRKLISSFLGNSVAPRGEAGHFMLSRNPCVLKLRRRPVHGLWFTRYAAVSTAEPITDAEYDLWRLVAAAAT